MNPGLVWMLAGIVICGADLVVPGVFLLWIGLAAMLAGAVVALALPGPTSQVVIFLLSLAGLLSIPILRRRWRPRPDGGINAPDSQLLGRRCRALAFEGREGRVVLGDGTWQARMVEGSAPVPGTALRIVGLDGTTLLVSAAGVGDRPIPPPDAV